MKQKGSSVARDLKHLIEELGATIVSAELVVHFGEHRMELFTRLIENKWLGGDADE